MANEKIMYDIEQTFYGKLFMEKCRIQVTTKTGWVSDICQFCCEISWPFGLELIKKDDIDTYRFFVPFENIDHIQIFPEKDDVVL